MLESGEIRSKTKHDFKGGYNICNKTFIRSISAEARISSRFVSEFDRPVGNLLKI